MSNQHQPSQDITFPSLTVSSLPETPVVVTYPATAACQGDPDHYAGEGETGTKPVPKQKARRLPVEVVETHTAPYTDAHALAALQCMGAIWRTLQAQKTDTAA
jgi:hypothetical protein